MEGGLPAKYRAEEELERQRRTHDSLISEGLSVISDSYLDVFERRCREAGVPFERKSMEGRNFRVLVEDIERTGYDLVVLGDLGLGAVKDSQIGSVCERVVRRIRTDVLVVKSRPPSCLHRGRRGGEIGGGKIIVAIDGSAYAFGGLKLALALGGALEAEVEVISAFDPYFHTTAFKGLAGVLSDEAGDRFRFKEQEKVHDEIIDLGMAKIYQGHLDLARRIAEENGAEVKTALLSGKPFEQILHYVKSQNPWLLVLGRIGVHSEPDMDIGSTTENLLRLVGCHVLISSTLFVPPPEPAEARRGL